MYIRMHGTASVNNQEKRYQRLRRIQLLVQIFNLAHSQILLPLLICPSIVQIITIYTIIRSIGGRIQILPTISIFLVLLIVDTGLVILGIFGSGGDVYNTSTKILFDLKRETTCVGRQRKAYSLRMQSIPNMKIRFGGSNFVDWDTAIKFCNFNVCRVVDLLLLG